MRKYLLVGLVVLALTLLAWTGLAAVKSDLFEALKFSGFRLGMTERRVVTMFESRGELLERTQSEMAGIKIKSLTFRNGDLGEVLRLEFVGDELRGFSYTNFEVGQE